MPHMSNRKKKQLLKEKAKKAAEARLRKAERWTALSSTANDVVRPKEVVQTDPHDALGLPRHTEIVPKNIVSMSQLLAQSPVSSPVSEKDIDATGKTLSMERSTSPARPHSPILAPVFETLSAETIIASDCTTAPGLASTVRAHSPILAPVFETVTEPEETTVASNCTTATTLASTVRAHSPIPAPVFEIVTEPAETTVAQSSFPLVQAPSRITAPSTESTPILCDPDHVLCHQLIWKGASTKIIEVASAVQHALNGRSAAWESTPKPTRKRYFQELQQAYGLDDEPELKRVNPATHRGRQFQCGECEKLYRTENGFKGHLPCIGEAKRQFPKLFKLDKKIPCPNCGKLFEDLKGMEVHKNDKHGNHPINDKFKCGKCGKVFGRHSRYVGHNCVPNWRR